MSEKQNPNSRELSDHQADLFLQNYLPKIKKSVLSHAEAIANKSQHEWKRNPQSSLLLDIANSILNFVSTRDLGGYDELVVLDSSYITRGFKTVVHILEENLKYHEAPKIMPKILEEGERYGIMFNDPEGDHESYHEAKDNLFRLREIELYYTDAPSEIRDARVKITKELLKQDPSGLKLVEEVAQAVTNGDNQNPLIIGYKELNRLEGSNPKLVSAGTALAVEVYGTAYSLVQTKS